MAYVTYGVKDKTGHVSCIIETEQSESIIKCITSILDIVKSHALHKYSVSHTPIPRRHDCFTLSRHGIENKKGNIFLQFPDADLNFDVRNLRYLSFGARSGRRSTRNNFDLQNRSVVPIDI